MSKRRKPGTDPQRSRAIRSPGNLALALLLGLSAGAGGTASSILCQDDSICIDEFRDGTRAGIAARNLRDFPITFTVDVHSGPGVTRDGERVTATLAPREHRRLRQWPVTSGDAPVPAAFRLRLAYSIGDREANHDDDHLYAFPYQAGRSYPVLQGFGSRFSHYGSEEFAVDFDMAEGTPVHAARAGIVARVVASNDRGCWKAGCGRYANFIVVLHGDGTTGEYYHLQKDGAFVAEGDSVARGQRIGLSGNTGHTAMPHLHFAVYRPTSGGQTQSIPVRFQSADGIVGSPRRGSRHQAAY